MTDEAREIAARLTEAQRRALKRAEPDGQLGFYFIRWWVANDRTLGALVKSRIGTVVWSGVALTPFGLAVRAVLMEGRDG